MSPKFSYRCFFFLVLCGGVLTFGPLSAALVINEFLPDPEGADGGKEFVEFLNTGSTAINLENLEFQFANGSTGPEWETRYSLESEFWLAPGARFLLVDRNWTGQQPFDGQAWLGLQNGPDAIRLVLGGEVVDLVGYGPLTDAEMMEESATPMVAGLSLLRKPDGHDTNNNSLDFVSGIPTPGNLNFQDYALEIIQAEMTPPSLPEVGADALLELILSNTGLLDLQPCNLALMLEGESGEISTVLETVFSGLQAGNQNQLVLSLRPPLKGRFSLVLEFSGAGLLEPLKVFPGKIQVGAGDVFLTEVLGSPADHQGEWIEIQAAADAVDLENYSIRDEEGTWRQLPAIRIFKGQFLLVAQDSTALMAWHNENLNQGAVLDCPDNQINLALNSLSGSWPSLNNSAPEGRSYADRIYLADSGGVIDHVTLPGDDQASDFQGASWERMSHDIGSFNWSQWRNCVSPQGGTPGCLNSVANNGLTGQTLEVEPAILDPSRGHNLTHIRFNLEEGEIGWHVEVFDLWGGLVRDLGGGEPGPGPGDIIWDGHNESGQAVASGGYIVLLLKSGTDGVFNPTAKELVVVR